MPTQGLRRATGRATVCAADLSKPIAHKGGGKTRDPIKQTGGLYRRGSLEVMRFLLCRQELLDQRRYCQLASTVRSLPWRRSSKMRSLFIAIIAATTACVYASPMPPTPPTMASPAPKMSPPPVMNPGMGARPPPPPPKDAEDAAVRVSSVGSCAVSLICNVI